MTIEKPGRPPPLVSVVIPAYNSAMTIMRALESVWQQDYQALDLIVVNDASSDTTRHIVEACVPRGVRLINLERQHGASGARNAGIAAANGEYIAFLDADDQWLPTKTSKQVALMAMNERMSFVTCRAEHFTSSGQPLGILGPRRFPATGPEAWRTLLAHTFVATPCVLARRSALREVGGFDTRLRIAEDQDLWIRLALIGEVGYVYETLVRVYDQPNSLSKLNARDDIAVTLPMILAHVNAQRPRLSHREVRQIIGERLTSAGRSAYTQGLYGIGLRHLLHAVCLFYRPWENLRYLLVGSPPVRALRARLARRGPL